MFSFYNSSGLPTRNVKRTMTAKAETNDEAFVRDSVSMHRTHQPKSSSTEALLANFLPAIICRVQVVLDVIP